MSSQLDTSFLCLRTLCLWVVYLSICPLVPLSQRPWGNPFRFGRNVPSDSGMNWFDSGGQRSKSLWFYKTLFLSLTWYLNTSLREFLQIWFKHSHGRKEELIRFWWLKGHKSRSLWTVNKIYQEYPEVFSLQLSLGLKNDLIRIWLSKVRGPVHCHLTSGRN